MFVMQDQTKRRKPTPGNIVFRICFLRSLATEEGSRFKIFSLLHYIACQAHCWIVKAICRREQERELQVYFKKGNIHWGTGVEPVGFMIDTRGD